MDRGGGFYLYKVLSPFCISQQGRNVSAIYSDYVSKHRPKCYIMDAAEKQYFYSENENRSSKENNCQDSDISIQNAGADDVKLLAAMNRELIHDEGSENPMSPEQLEERMKGFLLTEYKAVLILLGNEIAGYCLYRMDNQKGETSFDIYVRQYYIKPVFRRKGLGKRAFSMLLESTFRNAAYVKLDVLISNPGGKAFWAKIGFETYCHSLRIKP